ESGLHGIAIRKAGESIALVPVLRITRQAWFDRSLRAKGESEGLRADCILGLVSNIRRLELRLPRRRAVDEFAANTDCLGGRSTGRADKRELGGSLAYRRRSSRSLGAYHRRKRRRQSEPQ